MHNLIFNKYIKLPARYKSTVYLIEDGKIEEYIVEEYDIEFEDYTGNVYVDLQLKHKTQGFTVFCTEEDFKENYYKKKSAAEKALRKLKLSKQRTSWSTILTIRFRAILLYKC